MFNIGDIAYYNDGKKTRCVLVLKEIQKAWGATRYQVAFLDKKIYVWDKNLQYIKGVKNDKS